MAEEHSKRNRHVDGRYNTFCNADMNREVDEMTYATVVMQSVLEWYIAVHPVPQHRQYTLH